MKMFGRLAAGVAFACLLAPAAIAGDAATSGATLSNDALTFPTTSFDVRDEAPASPWKDLLLPASCLDSGYSCKKDSDCCNNDCVEPPGICG